jgi:hypothetical protein
LFAETKRFVDFAEDPMFQLTTLARNPLATPKGECVATSFRNAVLAIKRATSRIPAVANLLHPELHTS